jgi:hypothetical protein
VGTIGTPSTSAVAVSNGRIGVSSGQPSPNDHVGEAGLPVDRLTLSATSASTLLPVPSFVRSALVDPNWRHAMKEEFAALIVNNTWDLVPHPVGSNVITDKVDFQSQV